LLCLERLQFDVRLEEFWQQLQENNTIVESTKNFLEEKSG
jgi:hypothetical protein